LQETTSAVKSARPAGALAAAMLLALYCAPVLAASGIDCDRATDRPKTLEIAAPDLTDPDLTITVTDHSMTSEALDDTVNIDVTAPSLALAPEMAPRADMILRRIFDESYSSAELDELEPASATDAKSIAELALPPNSGQGSTDTSDSELPSLDADLPGISEDETLRYRRQMFRTDI
jgi:hypothetical protein